jgi:hypothetical protein
MNGRIYDPRLGRFMQADSIVDGVYDTQGYNRYSYLQNNPLNGTDPTGHFNLRQAVGVVVGVVLAVVTYGAATAVGGWAATVGATVNGYAASYVSLVGVIAASSAAGAIGAFSSTFIVTGGDFKSALKSGLRGAAAGAFTGGAAGFVSDLGFSNPIVKVGSFGADVAAVLARAVGGCAAGSVSGGSCSKGAQHAAFSEALNVGMARYSGYKPTWKTADGDAVVKAKQDIGVHDANVSNVGQSIEVDINGPAGHLVGTKLKDLNRKDVELLTDEFGGRVDPKLINWADGKVHFGGTTEASPLFTFIAKNVPGMNGMAVFHDHWMASGQVENFGVLAGTIAIAMPINYVALGANNYNYLYENVVEKN